MAGSSCWQRKETIGLAQKVANYSSLSSLTIRRPEFFQSAQQSMNLEPISSSDTEPVAHIFQLLQVSYCSFAIIQLFLYCWYTCFAELRDREARQLIQHYTGSDAAEEGVSETLGRCPNYSAIFIQHTLAVEELGTRLKFHLSKSHLTLSV